MFAQILDREAPRQKIAALYIFRELIKSARLFPIHQTGRSWATPIPEEAERIFKSCFKPIQIVSKVCSEGFDLPLIGSKQL